MFYFFGAHEAEEEQGTLQYLTSITKLYSSNRFGDNGMKHM
jgi:hypothetical protein